MFKQVGGHEHELKGVEEAEVGASRALAPRWAARWARLPAR